MAKRYTIHPHNSGGYTLKPTSSTTDDVVVLYHDHEAELAEAREEIDQLRAKLRHLTEEMARWHSNNHTWMFNPECPRCKQIVEYMESIDEPSDTPPADERDELLHRAAKTITSLLGDQDWCLPQADQWLTDYRRLIESTTTVTNCSRSRQEET